MEATRFRFIDSTPVWRGVQSLVGAVLRLDRSPPQRRVQQERIARRTGNECCEFLAAVRSFEEAGNSLERYQLLAGIIEGFVHPGAQRAIPVSESCRRDILSEWREWAGKESIAPRIPFEALADAVIEISTLLVVGPAV